MSIIDFDSRSGQPRKKKLGLALVASACIAGVISIGSVVAGGISLNGGGGSAEFGQGYVTTTTCDSDGIEVTPAYGYENSAGEGNFAFSTIQITGVSANCENKDLIVKVYDELGVPLPLIGNSVTEIRVWFQPFINVGVIAETGQRLRTAPVTNIVSLNGDWWDQFLLVGPSPIGSLPIEIWTNRTLRQKVADEQVTVSGNANQAFELHPNENGFDIVFDVNDFPDARDVYNISIQSVDHQS